MIKGSFAMVLYSSELNISNLQKRASFILVRFCCLSMRSCQLIHSVTVDTVYCNL